MIKTVAEILNTVKRYEKGSKKKGQDKEIKDKKTKTWHALKKMAGYEARGGQGKAERRKRKANKG